MACLTPLKGFRIGLTDSGANKYKICSWDVQFVDVDGRGQAVPGVDDNGAILPHGWRRVRHFIEIPCGQCLGCRQQRSREWANRMMCEAMYHEHNWFLTLTYDDGHVPLSDWIDDDGVVRQSLTLRPKDLQDFWKRLRKSIEPEKVRYFACGEYGDTTARPHYHAIVFGLELLDLVYYKSDDKYTYYTSEFLSRLWPFGFVIVAAVSWASCAYVAAYCTKKLNGKLATEVYGRLNIAPPFNVMSRKPGIGYQYYNDVVSKMDEDNKYINIATPDGGRKFVRPRYYKKLDLAIHDNASDLSDAYSTEVEKQFWSNYDAFDDLYLDNLANRDIIELSTDDYYHHLASKQANALAQLKSRKGV